MGKWDTGNTARKRKERSKRRRRRIRRRKESGRMGKQPPQHLATCNKHSRL